DEFVLVRKRPHKLDLQVAAGLANAHAIFLTEAVEQLNTLLEHAIPGVAMRVFELLILIKLPLLKQHRSRVLVEKEGGQSPFKDASEEHGCPGVFLFPAIEITMTVAPRAGQVLTDLGRVVDHESTSEPGGSPAAMGESSFQRLSGANPFRLMTDMPCPIV